MLFLGLFFMGLTGGIGLSAIINAITNHTTVENAAEPAGNTWHLALRVRPGEKVGSDVRTITFPGWTDANHDELEAYLKSGSSALADRSDEKTLDETSAPDSEQSTLAEPEPPSGPTFAIVESSTFANPWDVGKLANLRQIMGHNILGWLLPLRTRGSWSCYNTLGYESGGEEGAVRSFFPTGLDVDVLRAKAGLRASDQGEEEKYRRKMGGRERFPYLLGGAGAPMVSPIYRIARIWLAYGLSLVLYRSNGPRLVGESMVQVKPAVDADSIASASVTSVYEHAHNICKGLQSPMRIRTGAKLYCMKPVQSWELRITGCRGARQRTPF